MPITKFFDRTELVQIDLYVMSNLNMKLSLSIHLKEIEVYSSVGGQSVVMNWAHRDRRLITALHRWPSHHGPVISICPPATGHLYTFLIDSSITSLSKLAKVTIHKQNLCLTARTTHPPEQLSTEPSTQPDAQEPTTLWNQCSTDMACLCLC